MAAPKKAQPKTAKAPVKKPATKAPKRAPKKAPKTRAAAALTAEVPALCSTCDPCKDLATGDWGVFWHDAAGALRCLPFTAAGTQVLKGDTNGPFWANP